MPRMAHAFVFAVASAVAATFVFGQLSLVNWLLALGGSGAIGLVVAAVATVVRGLPPEMLRLREAAMVAWVTLALMVLGSFQDRPPAPREREPAAGASNPFDKFDPPAAGDPGRWMERQNPTR